MNTTLNVCVVAFFILALVVCKFGGIDTIIKNLFHKKDKDDKEQ